MLYAKVIGSDPLAIGVLGQVLLSCGHVFHKVTLDLPTCAIPVLQSLSRSNAFGVLGAGRAGVSGKL